MDLDLEPGRRYVLLGASGSGKSTLLRLLNRLDDPDGGAIFVGDRPLRDVPIRVLREAVGLVAQQPRPLEGTVAENLAYPRIVRDRRPPDRAAMAASLAEVGLDTGLLDRDATALSGGERQRLGVAVALVVAPEILLLDEPTSALDPASARTLAEMLRRRAESTGLRTVAVCHHRQHAEWLGDVAVALAGGVVAEVGPVAEVVSRIDA